MEERGSRLASQDSPCCLWSRDAPVNNMERSWKARDEIQKSCNLASAFIRAPQVNGRRPEEDAGTAERCLCLVRTRSWLPSTTLILHLATKRHSRHVRVSLWLRGSGATRLARR